jgi:hypothetical protein
MEILRLAAVMALTAVLTLALSPAAHPPRLGGYTVSQVRWELAPADTVSAVDFDLTPPGVHALRVRVAPQGSLLPCAVRAGHARCAVPSLPLRALGRLEIAAS